MISGEMHYARIPRAYWTNRLQMARAMGLGAVSTYVFWNIHEPKPERYDFSGQNEVAQFVREAAQAGLDVILRPGPYVCAERDFGGLPAWLLGAGDFASEPRGGAGLATTARARWARTSDERFMRPVRRWLRRLGEELAPLQRSRDGPIIAIQLENEYGAFAAARRGTSNDDVGCDGLACAKDETRDYLGALREALVAAGFDESTLFTIDQPDDLAAGSLPDIPIAVTFGPGRYASVVEQLRSIEARMPVARAPLDAAPLRCGEYWAGWFDHWGESRPADDEDQQVADLEQMLADGCTLNIYMLHGGTNFEFTAGANAGPTPETDGAAYASENPMHDAGGDVIRRYRPVTTSYDYYAAIDEAGRPRSKYFRFRETIARYTSIAPPPVPDAPPTSEVAEFVLNELAPLRDTLPQPILSERPLPMEAYGQSYGYILYRAHIGGSREAIHPTGLRGAIHPAGSHAPKQLFSSRDPTASHEAILSVERINDYAVIMLDGRVVANLDRRLDQRETKLALPTKLSYLEILVENSGRINYGPELGTDRKGIDGSVYLGREEIRNWLAFPLPFDDLASLRFEPIPTSPNAMPAGPAFYRGTFELDQPADTFLDARSLGKGALWVNGHNAGRFWNIGPQQSLYVPGVWLRPGINEVIAFDLFGCEKAPRLRGLRDPVFGLSVNRP